MKVEYIGINPTWIDASWTAYDPGTDGQVSKGRNLGRVNPGDTFDVDLETATKLLQQPGFISSRPTAKAADYSTKAEDSTLVAKSATTLSTEVPLRP